MKRTPFLHLLTGSVFSLSAFFISPSHFCYAADKKEPKAAAATATEAPPEMIAVQKCEQAVSYSWKRIAPKVEEPAGGGGKKGRPAGPPPTPDPDLYSVNELVTARLSETAPTADEAKALLNADLVAALKQAATQCADEHQSQGECSAKKLSSMGTQFDRLSFEAKRTVQIQIISDCQLSAGVCLGTKGGEVTCAEQKVPAPTPTPGETGKEPKKK